MVGVIIPAGGDDWRRLWDDDDDGVNWVVVVSVSVSTACASHCSAFGNGTNEKLHSLEKNARRSNLVTSL